MPFSRPTLIELIDRIVSDISRGVTGVDGAVIRRSLLGVIGKSEAGAIHHLYGYLDWISKQAIIDTAEDEVLERWAAIWKIIRKQATYAIGGVTFAGTNAVVIPIDTVIQRADGAEFKTTAAGTVASGTVTVQVIALVAGSDGDTVAGIAMSLASPVAGIQSAGAAAVGGLTGGTDTETNAALRGRLIQRIQQPPHGGAQSDYETWALEVPGVTRAWVYPLEDGAGTVAVRFVVDNDGIIPDGAKITEVQDYIDAPNRRPVTADVTVKALTAHAMDVSVAITPNTAEVRAAITAELDDLLRREAEPGGTIPRSHIREAISIASGETDSNLTVPSADFTSTSGQFPTLGTITFSGL